MAIKDEVRRIVDRLPKDATWDDIMYEMYIKQKVAGAEADAAGGKVVSHEEARKRMASR